jgi:hypothetical protein
MQSFISRCKRLMVSLLQTCFLLKHNSQVSLRAKKDVKASYVSQYLDVSEAAAAARSLFQKEDGNTLVMSQRP